MMPVKRQKSWCRPDVCGIRVVETSFALTQVFLRFPETPDLTAIVIAVANPVTAIANRVDGGPHRGLDHSPIQLDLGLAVFRTPLRFQRMGTGVVPAITVQHTEIPMPWSLACTQAS